MSEDIHANSDERQQKLTPDELQELEDKILNDTAGGTNAPVSPNMGC